jgi:UDP-N-acetylglucosamine 2-epimerase (non-hydrolysing)
LPVIFTTHPRTQKKILNKGIVFDKLIVNMPPFGFFDYIHLQKNAYFVLSDSGTISEESAMFGFPAVSIRTSTERPEAIDSGTIVLGGISSSEVLNAIEILMKTYEQLNQTLPWEYQVKDVSQRVIRVIQSYTAIVDRVIWNKL